MHHRAKDGPFVLPDRTKEKPGFGLNVMKTITCALGATLVILVSCALCLSQTARPRVSEARSVCPCGPGCCCDNCQCSLHQAQIPVKRAAASWPPGIKMTQSPEGTTLVVPSDLFPITIVVGAPTVPQVPVAPAQPLPLPPVQKPVLPPSAGKPPVSWPPPPYIQKQLEKPNG